MPKQRGDRAILAEVRRVIDDIGYWYLKADTLVNRSRAVSIIDDLVHRREGPITRAYRSSKKENARWNAAKRAEGFALTGDGRRPARRRVAAPSTPSPDC